MSDKMVDAFEAEVGPLTEAQRATLEHEHEWFLSHGAWRCRAVMSNGRSDIRCDRAEKHEGAHSGRFLNGSARLWGDPSWHESANTDHA